MKNLRRSVISMFACMVLGVAKQSSSQFSIIYYQSEIPEKLKG
jgi:cyclic lactone autoinducer peptide